MTLLLPAGCCCLAGGLAPLLGRHLRRPSLPALKSTLSPESDRSGVLTLVRIDKGCCAGRLIHDLTRKLIYVLGALT